MNEVEDFYLVVLDHVFSSPTKYSMQKMNLEENSCTNLVDKHNGHPHSFVIIP